MNAKAPKKRSTSLTSEQIIDARKKQQTEKAEELAKAKEEHHEKIVVPLLNLFKQNLHEAINNKLFYFMQNIEEDKSTRFDVEVAFDCKTAEEAYNLDKLDLLNQKEMDTLLAETAKKFKLEEKCKRSCIEPCGPLTFDTTASSPAPATVAEKEQSASNATASASSTATASQPADSSAQTADPAHAGTGDSSAQIADTPAPDPHVFKIIIFYEFK